MATRRSESVPSTDPPGVRDPGADMGASRARDLPRSGMLEQFAAIVESSDDAIVGKALDGTILSWNLAAARMYGYSAQEVLGRRISLIVPPEQARELESILRVVGRGDRVDHLETVRMRRNGSRFDVSVTVSPIRNELGTIVGASAIARDISERKHTEAILRAKEKEIEQTCGFLERAEAMSRTGTWILGLGDPPTLSWSKECFRLLGMDETTPLTVELFFSLVHPDDRERLSTVMATAIAEHRSYEVEHRLVAADGSLRRLHVWAQPDYDDEGVAVRVLGVAQDITDRYEADEALRASERRFRLLAENAVDFIFRYELLPEPHFDYASPASLEVTGYAPDELYEDPSLIDRLVDPRHTAEMSELLVAGGLTDPMDVEVHRRDGTVGWASQQLTFVYDDDGQLLAVEGISRDITCRKRAEEQLAHQGLHDALTGLPNRLLLRDRLDLALTRSEREQDSVVVVALDLDDFKLINDTHGQEAGDSVLVSIAERLGAAVAQQDTLARTGSDEFIVVAESTSDDEVLVLVERVRGVLRTPVHTEGADLYVHGSIGVATGGSSASAASLLRDADLALSRAKQGHERDSVEFFNPDMCARTDQRFALISDLHRALECDEFLLRYQPVLKLPEGRITGAEALIRWDHPRRGLVSPAEFIAIAEETGHIIEIGAWVLETACAQLAAWSNLDATMAELSMAVNVSVHQLRAPGAVLRINEIVTRSGIDPTRLTLEITESVFMDDVEQFRQILVQLRELGIRIAVDDFGTGYSSLIYLKQLPFDTLKIDQAFTKGLGIDPYDGAIVASALTLARAMGLNVVAEGVETSAQLAELRALNCAEVQGYYVSKPISPEDLRSLVSAHRRW